MAHKDILPLLYKESPLLKLSLHFVASLQNSLVIDTPRVRKQTRPFSATKDELAELSEGESDSDETKPKLRRNHDRLNSYGRTECFRVEKNLLVYGWDDSCSLRLSLYETELMFLNRKLTENVWQVTGNINLLRLVHNSSQLYELGFQHCNYEAIYMLSSTLTVNTFNVASCNPGGVVGRTFSNMGDLRSSSQSGTWSPSAGPCCLTAWSITVEMTKSKASCGTWSPLQRTDAPRSCRITWVSVWMSSLHLPGNLTDR